MTTTRATATCYRWSDLPQDRPMAGIDRRRIIGANAMLSEVALAAGTHIPTHHHANEQIAVILSGEMRFGIGADDSADRYEVTLRGGEVLHLPPNVPHSADAVTDSRVLDVFSPPSEKTGIDAHG